MEQNSLDWYNEQLKIRVGDSLGNCRLKIKPMPHQWESFLFHLDTKHKSKSGDYSSEGCGKTLVLLLTALTYICWGNKVAFFTLRGLMPQLQSEIELFFENYPCEAVIQPLFQEDEEYEIPTLGLYTYHTLIIPRYWRIYKQHYDFLILDEASEIKNGLGRRFERVKTLMKYNKGILLATATPYHISPADCFSLINLTMRGFKDFYSYRRRYAVLDHFGSVKEWINLPNIKHKLFTHGLRFTKEKIMSLPEPIVSYRTLTLNSQQAEVNKRFFDYSFYENESGEFYDASYSSTLKHQRMIESISNPRKFGVEVDSIIMDDLQYLMESLYSSKLKNERIVVFFIYAETAHHYYNSLSFLFDIARVYDEYNESESFKHDDEVRAVFCTYRKGSRGFNFQNASFMYIVEISPSAGEMSQAINRIQRPGRKGNAIVYLPNIAGSAYDKSLTKLKERAEDMGNIIDVEKTLISKL